MKNFNLAFDPFITQKMMKLAIPTWMAFLSKDLLGIADMFFVSKLGPESIAAVSLCGIVLGIIFMIGHGITSGTVATVSQAVGRQDSEASKKYSTQSIIVAFFCGLLISAICIPLASDILRLVGADENVVAIGTPYLRVLAAVASIMLVIFSLETSIRGNNDANTPFKSMLTANIVNIILDPILIYGWFGFPKMGVTGSAVATLIAFLFAFSILSYSILFGKNKGRIVSRKYIKIDFEAVKKIWTIGIFSSGKMLISNIYALFFMRLVASFGTIAVAAFGIGLRLRILIFGASMGFGAAASVLTGQFIGAGQIQKAKKAIYQNVVAISVISAFLNILFFVFATQIVRIFTDNAEVLAYGTDFLRWFSFSFVFMGASIVLGNAMDGAGYTKLPMLNNILGQIVIGLPTAYYFSSTFLGIKGVWLSLVLSQVFLMFFLIFDIRRNRWYRA